jgi:cystathionine gamma-synthase
VVHSPTKYLGGHSDVVGGFVALDDDELAERSASSRTRPGGAVAVRLLPACSAGVKTLAVRMDRHCANARRVAERWPSTRPSTRVLWPGSPTTPATTSAAPDARLRRHGVVPRARGRGRRAGVAARTELFTLAESLGAVESLIEHPGRMTHASRGRLAARRSTGAWSGCRSASRPPPTGRRTLALGRSTP